MVVLVEESMSMMKRMELLLPLPYIRPSERILGHNIFAGFFYRKVPEEEVRRIENQDVNFMSENVCSQEISRCAFQVMSDAIGQLGTP